MSWKWRSWTGNWRRHLNVNRSFLRWMIIPWHLHPYRNKVLHQNTFGSVLVWESIASFHFQRRTKESPCIPVDSMRRREAETYSTILVIRALSYRLVYSVWELQVSYPLAKENKQKMRSHHHNIRSSRDSRKTYSTFFSVIDQYAATDRVLPCVCWRCVVALQRSAYREDVCHCRCDVCCVL